ncbi:SLC13 family permease [Prosthecobacter sp. SYSU 5D2]|uniref:SLC13 family permease n=1 Tax=Prosthecobacter sp. SYSU 5D2 TaxID=3134134 RepID=UPI0031FE482B
MTQDQVLILLILTATVGMFLWAKWRHDMVAMGSLLACVACGLVPAEVTFAGFGHPAVITVACVLVLSRALQTTGAIDQITRRLIPRDKGPTLTIGILTGVAAVLSAFMNNVGALALLMPVSIQAAQRKGLPPGKILMPVAFGSILGGMTTLIGTPPNLIVSGFRAQMGGGGFAMFDFTPVGLAVAGAGVVFVALVGWRLVPARERSGVEGFETDAYITEARIGKDAKAVGKTLREIGPLFDAADAQVIGMVRNNFRVTVPNPDRILQEGDVLVIEAEPDNLAHALSSVGLELDAIKDPKAATDPEKSSEVPNAEGESKKRAGEEISLMELTVLPGTDLVSRSAADIQLRTRFGINLLALSRKGQRSIRRMRSEPIRAGDVLLMQGPADAILGFASEFGCVPLAERAIRIPDKRAALISALVMLAAVSGAALGLLPAAISFAAGVLAMMSFRVVSLRNVYDAVDWPVIVLLGALIPVAGAMETTGAADLLAQMLVANVASGSPVFSLALLLIVTMTLSDFMNNAATAAVMCPVAISIAAELGVKSDPFLMAVALGASCAFLTPIGHQNNTIILGPGGFRFGDYWKLGLPLEILVMVVAIPLLLVFWPL